jgi:hypothetical protein
MKVRTFSVLALVFGLALLLALVVAIEEAQMKGAEQAILHVVPADPATNLAAPQDSTRLGHTLQITFTPVATVYLPLVANNYPLSYFDDFSNPNSGWYIGDEGDFRFSYQNGEYEILIRNIYESASAAVIAPIDGVSDCSVEADMRRHAGSGGYYGLIFSMMDWDRFYVFIVDPDTREYSVWRNDPTDWTSVIGGTYSSYINSSTATNHLKVERKGGQITVYANGHLLTSTNDDTYTAGLYVGLYAETASYTTLAVRFDNFRVSGE